MQTCWVRLNFVSALVLFTHYLFLHMTFRLDPLSPDNNLSYIIHRYPKCQLKHIFIQMHHRYEITCRLVSLWEYCRFTIIAYYLIAVRTTSWSSYTSSIHAELLTCKKFHLTLTVTNDKISHLSNLMHNVQIWYIMHVAIFLIMNHEGETWLFFN